MQDLIVAVFAKPKAVDEFLEKLVFYPSATDELRYILKYFRAPDAEKTYHKQKPNQWLL